MSKRAEALVWERSRAKGSNLLMLVRIADVAGHDGRDAWPQTEFLARETRMSLRGAQYVLHRLEADGELVIDNNAAGRSVEINGRAFQPAWFLHIRCVYDWESYQQDDTEFANFASSPFRRGRRKVARQIANTANYSAVENRKDCAVNRNLTRNKSQNRVSHIEVDPLVDPLLNLEQGAAPPNAPESAGAAPRSTPENSDDKKPEDTPADNIRVITKLVHDCFDILGFQSDDREIGDWVKDRCAELKILYDTAVTWKAIDSARFQRRRRLA